MRLIFVFHSTCKYDFTIVSALISKPLTRTMMKTMQYIYGIINKRTKVSNLVTEPYSSTDKTATS